MWIVNIYFISQTNVFLQRIAR
eukprot:UN07358